VVKPYGWEMKAECRFEMMTTSYRPDFDHVALSYSSSCTSKLLADTDFGVELYVYVHCKLRAVENYKKKLGRQVSIRFSDL
jgi:hypothetical protein